jgi:hypothetical protein
MRAMFKLDSEAVLLRTFRAKDRKRVELSRDVKLPLYVRHYVAWTHPAGGRVYLIFAVPGGAPTGIVFDSHGAGPAVPHMCDWCRCSGLGERIGLLTARLSSTHVVGVHVCSDLGCQRKLEDEANRRGDSVLPAMDALVDRMAAFAAGGLNINLRADRG